MENLYLKKYDDYFNQLKRLQLSPIVVKISGKTTENLATLDNILRQLIYLQNLGVNIILVHGAGPQISSVLGEKILDKNGERITPPDKMHLVLDTCRRISYKILKRAAHLSKQMNIDCASVYLGPSSLHGMVRDEEINSSADFVFMADIENILKRMNYSLYITRKRLLFGFEDLSKCVKPKSALFVVGHVGRCIKTSGLANINADNVAGGTAKQVRASKLLILGSTNGILDKNNKTIGEIRGISEIEALHKDKVISEGMLPKVKMAANVASHGIDVHIMPQDSRKYPDIILQDLLNKNGVPDRSTMITIFKQAYF